MTLPPVPPTIDLPIRYAEANMMMAAFSADADRLRLLTPAPLRVVGIGGGRAPLAVICFEYLRTSVGVYNEVGVGWPVVHPAIARLGAPPVLPLLAERVWPGVGWWIHRLPVTTEIANHAGRTLWGYPKLVASIDYAWDDATRICTLAEGGQEILRLAVHTRIPARPQRFPVVTYSALAGEILRTRIDVDAVGRRGMRGHAQLAFGPHPIGRELAALDVAVSRQVQVGWFPTWRALLPAAQQRWPMAAPARGQAGRDAA